VIAEQPVWSNAMSFRSLLASVLGLCLLASGELYAQTEEIQQQIETKLWILRVYQSFGVAGLPPGAVLLTLAAVVLAIGAGVWLWLARRKRAE
jgi:hypothetical protein